MTAVEAPPERNRLVTWWAGLGRGQRIAVAVVAVAVATNVVLAALASVIGSDPGGPASSPVGTGSDGLAAYAELLARDGHDVGRRRHRLGPADLAPGSTAIVADRSLDDDERSLLVDFVRRGGRMVVSGRSAESLLTELVDAEVRAVTSGPAEEIAVWLPVDGTGLARTLVGDGGARWQPAGSLLGVAGPATSGDETPEDAGAAVAVADAGRGRLVAVADTALLHNANLARADNAAFALAAAGPASRPVVFVEPNSSAAGAEGLSAVPDSWKLAAAGLAVALVAGLWSAASRFGPAEPDRRALRPPRLDHVTAVAADLDRVAPDPAAAVAPLAEVTRAALAERLGAPSDASPAVLYAAAERAGVGADHVALLVDAPAHLDAALAVGALAASRQRGALGTVAPDPHQESTS